MTGVRLSTRTDLKQDIFELYNSIESNSTKQALENLRSAKKNVIMYYNTRGLDCERLMPTFTETRNLLNKNFLNNPRKSEMAKRKLYKYLFRLNTSLRFDMVSVHGDVAEQDPLKLLRDISEDLIDDYSEFNLSAGQELADKNRKTLDLIRNDLLEMRELEPLMKQKAEQYLPLFNTMVKCANVCLMILPQVKDVTVSATTQRQFRTDFEGLFNVITEMFMPSMMEKGTEDKKEPVKEQAIVKEKRVEVRVEPKKKKEEKPAEEPQKEQTPGDEPSDSEEEPSIDLEELERKAKEGRIDGKTE